MMHSNISIEWVLDMVRIAQQTPRSEASRRAALFWRAHGKAFLPVCPTAQPDGSCSGDHPEPEKEKTT